MRSVGASVDAPFSQALRDIYSCPFTQLLESTHSMRKANGITPGYPLPPLKKSIHSLPQFRVTELEKEGNVCKSFCPYLPYSDTPAASSSETQT